MNYTRINVFINGIPLHVLYSIIMLRIAINLVIIIWTVMVVINVCVQQLGSLLLRRRWFGLKEPKYSIWVVWISMYILYKYI